MKHPFIFVSLLIIGVGCVAQELPGDLEAIVAERQPQLDVLTILEGDLLSPRLASVLVVYQDDRDRPRRPGQQGYSASALSEFIVYGFNGSEITQEVAIDTWSVGYENLSWDVESFDLVVPWNGFAYVYDYNSNEIDEVLVLNLFGNTFLASLWEYDGGEFAQVLDMSRYSGLILIDFIYSNVGGFPAFTAVLGGTNTRREVTYIWNEARGIYEEQR